MHDDGVKTQHTTYLTPDDLGKVFNVTGRTILNWEARKIITAAIRVGRVVRFDLDSVRAEIAEATKRGASVHEDETPYTNAEER